MVDLPTFFHRLDKVSDWNRALGRHGFVQYQFVVPEGEHGIIAEVLAAVQRQHCAPFLGTMKRFGSAGGGHLSFPLPGWSLAIDMPAHNPRLAPLLDELDRRVAAAGGRIYLAKDSRMSRGSCAATFPELADWRAERARLDPSGVFRSDLGRRIGLC